MKEKLIKILKSRLFQNVIFLLIIAFLLLLVIQQCSKRQHTIDSFADSYNAMNDSLIHYKNKYGESVAHISLIQFENNKALLKIKTNDSTIKELQSLVKEYEKKIKDNSVAAIIHITTEIHDTILVYHEGDTIYFDKENEWITLYGQIIKDSLSYFLLVNNKFKMIIGEENGKKYSEFISSNPYTSTPVLRVYQNIPRKKRFVLSAGIGAGAGVDLLTKKFCLPVSANINFGIKIFEF